MTKDQISSLPAIYRLLRWNAYLRLGRKSIRTKTPFGAIMDLEFIDQSATHIFFQHYETEETEVIRAHLKPGMTALDIGANIGYFTLLMAGLVGQTGRVFAFEPNPIMIAQLNKNVALNPDLLDGRVQFESTALGAQIGETDFYSPIRGAEGVGGLKDTKRAPLGETLKVPVTTLDFWSQAAGVNRIGFIKMDVEGGELDILKGARRVLELLKPVILFEAVEANTSAYGYLVTDILGFIREKGYEVKPLKCGYNFLALPS